MDRTDPGSCSISISGVKPFSCATRERIVFSKWILNTAGRKSDG